MRIAIPFDKGGLTRLGLQQVGHECVSFNSWIPFHLLSQNIGSGKSILSPPQFFEDWAKRNGATFDAVWFSPYTEEELHWALSFVGKYETVWVERHRFLDRRKNSWGTPYNAAQFAPLILQNRIKYFGGSFPPPKTIRPFQERWHFVPSVVPASFFNREGPPVAYMGLPCPALTDREYDNTVTHRKASGFYKRKLTVDECAFHQGLELPDTWRKMMKNGYKEAIYKAICTGNFLPMVRAFGSEI